MHARALACLHPGDRILEYEPLRTFDPLRLAHALFLRLAFADIAREHPRCGDEEDVWVRLAAARLDESIVRTNDALLEQSEELVHEMRALLLVVAPLRASRDCDGDLVFVQVLYELEHTRERLDGRPERVLADAALFEIVVNGEVRRQVGEEGKEVLGCLAFRCRGTEEMIRSVMILAARKTDAV